jgi:hypothetical protein
MSSPSSSQATSDQLTKRTKSLEEIKACTQKYNESLRLYIQRWSIIKNLAEDVFDERAIDAFTVRLHRLDFIEEMGRIRLKTVLELMDVAKKFADGEDTYHNKRTRSPEDDRSHRYSNQRHRSRNYDNYSSHSQLAVGYREDNNEGEEH